MNFGASDLLICLFPALESTPTFYKAIQHQTLDPSVGFGPIRSLTIFMDDPPPTPVNSPCGCAILSSKGASYPSPPKGASLLPHLFLLLAPTLAIPFSPLLGFSSLIWLMCLSSMPLLTLMVAATTKPHQDQHLHLFLRLCSNLVLFHSSKLPKTKSPPTS
jgi:hypothetical protein